MQLLDFKSYSSAPTAWLLVLILGAAAIFRWFSPPGRKSIGTFVGAALIVFTAVALSLAGVLLRPFGPPHPFLILFAIPATPCCAVFGAASVVEPRDHQNLRGRWMKALGCTVLFWAGTLPFLALAYLSAWVHNYRH